MPIAKREIDDDAAHVEFEALVRAERTRLYGIAYSILRDHAHAEDALQDTLVKAWRSWDQVRDEAARRAWLTRIAVTQCINRRQFLRLRLSGTLAADRHHAPDDPRMAGRMADFDRFYRALSRKQRAAILLHHYFGYSIDECAGLMQCSSGSVRTHLHRATTAMRKGMQYE
jgi:RNA polymerase sigma-70 factor (ECF subfamily)